MKRPNMSVEMFLQKLDELFEIREDYLKRQKELGIYDLNHDRTIVVHDEAFLPELAEYLNKDLTVKPTPKESYFTHELHLEYKGYDLCSFTIRKANSTLTDQS